MSKPTRKQAPPSAFRLGDDLTAAMARLTERDGITPSEQVRRALRAWLPTKGVLATPAPKRATKGGRK